MASKLLEPAGGSADLWWRNGVPTRQAAFLASLPDKDKGSQDPHLRQPVSESGGDRETHTARARRPIPTMNEKLITIAEAARRAGCSYQCAWFWSQGGKLEAVRADNGKLLGVTEESAKKMATYFREKLAAAARVKGE